MNRRRLLLAKANRIKMSGVKPLPTTRLVGNLPESILSLLGTQPDNEIARIANVSARTIFRERKRLGIPTAPHAKRPRTRWTKEMDALLGTTWDAVLARKFGLAVLMVNTRRRKLGIPSFKETVGGGVIWTPEALGLLGKVPDTTLAKRLRVSHVSVYRKRVELGLPAAVPLKAEWPDWAVELLGKIPDKRLAQRLGVSGATVRGERQRRGVPPIVTYVRTEWTEERVALLGTESDRIVASELGIPAATVAKARIIRGIPAYNLSSGRGPDEGYPWSPQTIRLLGTMSDQGLADKLGTTHHVVMNKRRKLCIPAFHQDKAPVVWTEEMLAMLGQRSDREVAETFGIAPVTVRRKRQAEGLPRSKNRRPHTHRRGEPKTPVDWRPGPMVPKTPSRTLIGKASHELPVPGHLIRQLRRARRSPPYPRSSFSSRRV